MLVVYCLSQSYVTNCHRSEPVVIAADSQWSRKEGLHITPGRGLRVYGTIVPGAPDDIAPIHWNKGILAISHRAPDIAAHRAPPHIVRYHTSRSNHSHTVIASRWLIISDKSYTGHPPEEASQQKEVSHHWSEASQQSLEAFCQTSPPGPTDTKRLSPRKGLLFCLSLSPNSGG